MKRCKRTRRLLLTAALGGLLAGAACGREPESARPSGSSRTESSLPATERPIASHVQLEPASLLQFVESPDTPSVVRATVVSVTEAPVLAPMRMTADLRSVCTLRVEEVLAGSKLDRAQVPCSMPDRVLSAREASEFEKSKEFAGSKGLRVRVDPAAIHYLPKKPWRVGTTSVFVLTPLHAEGLGDTHKAAPVTYEPSTGLLTLAPGHLTRTDVTDFEAPVTATVDEIVRHQREFVENTPAREAEIEAEVGKLDKTDK